MSDNRHKNYELLNLLGYGLAKFNMDFVRELGFKTKSALYESLVEKGIADTAGTVKNRQDLFDPFFDNGRRGWWRKGNAYIHRKVVIDNLFGELNSRDFANIVRLYIDRFEPSKAKERVISPILKSKFKQLQITGQEAEVYFVNHFEEIATFRRGILEDARLLGDGYDFQITAQSKFYLAEVKGLRSSNGSVRITENEFNKAKEYKEDYGLIVISNLYDMSKMTSIFNPLKELKFKMQIRNQEQISYSSELIAW